ncbi:MAG: hypothetical protein HXY39_02740 [Chloroflexi bacterium]|nr:hypothetical protein [Chloroflexota bacterium]
MQRLLFCVTLCMFVALASPGRAAARERCFTEVGYCISGPILAYWERHGGLRTFGFPISGLRLEMVEDRMLRVQWFERDRLEIQADGRVTAGRLGARYLELQGRPWQSFPTIVQAEPGCAYFAITGHQVCEPFLSYWRAWGGLERFGYPITGRIEETIEGRSYPVQYFERRRMEQHAELAGTPYEILLGRLGAAVMKVDSCMPLDPRHEPTAYAYRAILGCPVAPSRETVGVVTLSLRNVPLAVQRFEGGMMLWLRQFSADVISDPEVFVITPAPSGQGLVWQRFADQWREGMPDGVSDRPPDGLYAPKRGFGYLWASNAEVRNRLGWAIAPEQGETGGYRRFWYGFYLYLPSTDHVFLITDDGVARDVSRR